MTNSLGSVRGSYRDLSFSRWTSHASRPSTSDGYNSREDYTDFRFAGELETDQAGYLREKQNVLEAQSDAGDAEKMATSSSSDNAPRMGMKMKISDESKEIMRFPRVSQDSLSNDIEDFNTDLAVGLDSLQVVADSVFLTGDFLQESVALLQTLDIDVRILLEKLADLKGLRSVEFSEALLEYNSMSEKILEVCKALKFSMTLLKTYHNTQVEACVVAVEALVSLPKKEPRTVHVVKAEKAGQCIDRARAEMIEIQAQAHELVVSHNYGSLSYFAPSFNIMNVQSDFGKWSGLWGVLFAMKTATD